MGFKGLAALLLPAILLVAVSCGQDKKTAPVTGTKPPQTPTAQPVSPPNPAVPSAPAPAPGTTPPETAPKEPAAGPEGVPLTPGDQLSPSAPGTQTPGPGADTSVLLPAPSTAGFGPVTPQEPELFPSASTPIPNPKAFNALPTAPSQKPFREAMLHGREFLLEKVDYLRPVFPRDYHLGRLQGYLADTRDFAQGVQTAQEFLTSIMMGKTPEDLIISKWKLTIKTTLEDGYKEKLIPKGFRLGVLRTMEGGLMANIALMGTPGTARGQIYLDRDEKGLWKVSDFQINLAEMRVEPVKTEELYTPGAYPFLEGI